LCKDGLLCHLDRHSTSSLLEPPYPRYHKIPSLTILGWTWAKVTKVELMQIYVVQSSYIAFFSFLFSTEIENWPFHRNKTCEISKIHSLISEPWQIYKHINCFSYFNNFPTSFFACSSSSSSTKIIMCSYPSFFFQFKTFPSWPYLTICWYLWAGQSQNKSLNNESSSRIWNVSVFMI
jgi:hypothetical protein